MLEIKNLSAVVGGCDCTCYVGTTDGQRSFTLGPKGSYSQCKAGCQDYANGGRYSLYSVQCN